MTKKLAPIFRTDVWRFVSCLTRKEIATMRMKAAITRALVLPLVLLGFLAAVPPASAWVVANHSGTICKNYNAEDATLIDYWAYGTRSFKTAATWVVCPLTRNTTNGYGAVVYVDFKHIGTQTTTCTAYSYDSSGRLLASASKDWTGDGSVTLALNLSGSLGKSTTWSDYSVVCIIPGNRNGIVMSVDLYEQ